MINRSIIQLHELITSEYVFVGVPIVLFNMHSSYRFLITQKLLKSYFSKCGDAPKLFFMQFLRNAKMKSLH